MAHSCHGKIFLLTAISISPRQKEFHSRQNLFTHGNNFATAISIALTEKSSYSRQNQFRHGKIKFHPWLTFSRDISSQSAMGVNPTWRSSSWFLDSTCIAQTVEMVCLQQHISACSVDKVSRNWLMDVLKYTQCICRSILRLTQMQGKYKTWILWFYY